MQFSYSNNRILYKLAKRNYGSDILTMEGFRALHLNDEGISDTWEELSPFFRQNIHYITPKLESQLLDKGFCFKEKLADTANKSRHLRSYSSVPDCPGVTYIIGNYTYCFYANTEQRLYCLYGFFNNHINRKLYLTTYLYDDLIRSPGTGEYYFTGNGFNAKMKFGAMEFFFKLLTSNYNIENVDFCSKMVLAGFGRLETSTGITYNNNTNMNIHILDTAIAEQVINI